MNLETMAERKVVTVSQLNYYIKKRFENDEALKNLWIEGEISNFKAHSSGHLYFGLKDETSFLRAVMFRSSASKLKFRPENGQKVVVKGSVSVYERDGQYQLYVSSMEVAGVGDLYVALEQLKKKLNAEGLFDPSHKKSIPLYTPKIGVVTSPTGAVWHDIQNVSTARFPSISLLLYPASVQGDAAEFEVAAGIAYFNRRDDVGLIIVGRGGGSIEDLWAFNSETVARAIYRSRLPVISAVGHETDYTIADLVADQRAATPSHAAELAVPALSDLRKHLAMLNHSLDSQVSFRISSYHDRLKKIAESYIFQQKDQLFRNQIQQVDMLSQRLDAVFQESYQEKKNNYRILAEKLAMLSPLHTLERGYSICLKDGKLLHDASATEKGDSVIVQLSKGHLKCRIEEGNEENYYDR